MPDGPKSRASELAARKIKKAISSVTAIPTITPVWITKKVFGVMAPDLGRGSYDNRD